MAKWINSIKFYLYHENSSPFVSGNFNMDNTSYPYIFTIMYELEQS